MTNWWNKNAENRLHEFKGWVGDFNSTTKLYCRSHVIRNNYQSIIDCGCGLATEYFGYKHDNYDISYTGLDNCDFFIKTNRDAGITMVEGSLEEDLPIPDNSYDVVYCREVLEHLPAYEKAVSEFIRVGKKEVLISWFIKPWEDADFVDYWEEEDLFHNKYNLEKFEMFVLNNPKVKKMSWVDFDGTCSVLHIDLI